MHMAWPTSFAVLLYFFNRRGNFSDNPPANLGFAHDDVRVMTNESPWDCPTEANIVSRPGDMSLLLLEFVQRHAMRALVFDAQPHDSLLFYCA